MPLSSSNRPTAKRGKAITAAQINSGNKALEQFDKLRGGRGVVWAPWGPQILPPGTLFKIGQTDSGGIPRETGMPWAGQATSANFRSFWQSPGSANAQSDTPTISTATTSRPSRSAATLTRSTLGSGACGLHLGRLRNGLKWRAEKTSLVVRAAAGSTGKCPGVCGCSSCRVYLSNLDAQIQCDVKTLPLTINAGVTLPGSQCNTWGYLNNDPPVLCGDLPVTSFAFGCVAGQWAINTVSYPGGTIRYSSLPDCGVSISALPLH